MEIKISEDCSLNLEKLIATRMLINANSGGGKSWAIRRLLEQSHGQVQQIVIDLEGEFSTLREKFDYLLVGREGEIPANIRTAELLAKRLLELNVSTIIDLSELKKAERITFVKRFLDSLIDSPKNLWHPALILIDEAHHFAPEKDKAESSSSVIDLMTRGRKRGFCLHPMVEIITSEGIKKIKNIKEGDYVLTHKGRFRKVIATSFRDYAGEIIGIKSFGSIEPTFTTPNHLYFSHIVENSHGTNVLNKFCWIEADEIMKNKNRHLSHRLFSPNILEEEDIEFFDFSYKKRKRMRKTRSKKIREGFRDIKIPVNLDLMKVMGYFLAEGSYIKRKYQVEKNLCGIQFAFGKSKKEERIAKETTNSLIRLGYNPEMRTLKNGQFYVRLRVREIAELFKFYLGEYSYGKKIHKDILMLPKKKLKPLFESYINGDGHRRDNFIGASTVSKELVYSMFLIGQKLGYSTSVRVDKRKEGFIGNRKVNQRDIFRLSFKNLSTFSKNKKIEKQFARAIKSKSSTLYEGKVYNLEVDEDESYCSLSHVIHNCGILATQRISKLSKDAIAEANNCLIGRAVLDIDQKRAGDVLGFTSKEDVRALRDLDAGEFYTFGSAFNHTGVKKTFVGEIKTTHPDRTRGIDIKKATETPENIKKILKDITDLPKEAEEEIKTIQGMSARIKELKTKLTIAERSQKVEEKIKERLINVTDDKALQRAKEEGFKEAERIYKSYIAPIEQNSKRLKVSIIKLIKDAQGLLDSKAFILVGDLPIPSITPVNVKSTLKEKEKIYSKPATLQINQVKPKLQMRRESSVILDTDVKLGKCGRMIYSFLYNNPDRNFNISQIGSVTGYSSKSGGFSNAISKLKSLNLIRGTSSNLQVNELNPEIVLEATFEKENIINILNKCEKEIYQVLLENPNQEFSREELASMTPTNYSSSSGGFSNSLSRLNSLGLIKRNGGIIQLNPELLEI